jgi:uncharacterized protein YaeQ
VPADTHNGALQFARGLSDGDDPDIWQHDLTGQLQHWIEVGQPDERRMAKACSRATRVSIYAFAASTPIWWAGVQNKVARLPRLAVWQLPAEQSKALAELAARSMQLQLTVQDGQLWLGDGSRSVEIEPLCLKAANA